MRIQLNYKDFKKEVKMNTTILKCAKAMMVKCPTCDKIGLNIDKETVQIIGEEVSTKIYCSRCGFEDFI